MTGLPADYVRDESNAFLSYHLSGAIRPPRTKGVTMTKEPAMRHVEKIGPLTYWSYTEALLLRGLERLRKLDAKKAPPGKEVTGCPRRGECSSGGKAG